MTARKAEQVTVLLEARHIDRRIGQRTILFDVSLEVSGGEILGLFGPNGAGKTTLFRILSLLSRPSAGEIRLEGRTVDPEDDRIRRNIGLLSHQAFLYEGLTARENLLFYARMYDVPDAETRTWELLEQVGLKAFANDLARTFSRGMQQRLGLARVLLHRPRLLLLDEPHTGLDQRGAAILDAAVERAREEGAAVILVTHDLETGYRLSDRYVILAGGRVRGSGRTDEADWPAFQANYLALTGEAG